MPLARFLTASVAKCALALDALVQAVVETVAEDRQLAVQLELCPQHVLALEHVGRGQRGHAQAVHGALGGAPGVQLDAPDGSLDGRGQT